METICFACYNNNDDIRMKSSSGGVFYELSKYVIAQGGIVFGAKFDSNMNVVHAHADTLKGIDEFMGSKYVQSSMGNEYIVAKKFLEGDKLVLFSGTPCQVRGLCSFLGKDYPNLITVDFICHGVPSKVVWRKYIEKISNGRTITSVAFRDKTDGWEDYSLEFNFSDGSLHRQNMHDDLYIKGFLKNLYLRPSCHNCRFKGIERQSDITLADFWGVKNEMPNMYDGKGSSLVFIHTESGRDLWNRICDHFTFRPADIYSAVLHNPSAVVSASENKNRHVFFNSGCNIDDIANLTKMPLSQKIIQKIKRIIKKFIGRK